MITINDRVQDAITEEAGVIVSIHNGMYIVQMDNGDKNQYLEYELFPYMYGVEKEVV